MKLLLIPLLFLTTHLNAQPKVGVSIDSDFIAVTGKCCCADTILVNGNSTAMIAIYTNKVVFHDSDTYRLNIKQWQPCTNWKLYNEVKVRQAQTARLWELAHFRFEATQADEPLLEMLRLIKLGYDQIDSMEFLLDRIKLVRDYK